MVCMKCRKVEPAAWPEGADLCRLMWHEFKCQRQLALHSAFSKKKKGSRGARGAEPDPG